MSLLYVRYMSGNTPDMYRTSTGHELELLPCCILVPLGLFTGTVGDVTLKSLRCYFEEFFCNFDRQSKLLSLGYPKLKYLFILNISHFFVTLQPIGKDMYMKYGQKKRTIE